MQVSPPFTDSAKEQPVQNARQHPRNRPRLMAMDMAAQILLSFCIGLAMSIVLAAFALLLASPA